VGKFDDLIQLIFKPATGYEPQAVSNKKHMFYPYEDEV
jgi:hypothetical protein